jgi:tripartite ATP-independent transporter DctM subunit
MPWYEAGALLLGMVIVLIGLGVPVALTFMAVNIVGTLIFFGGVAGLIQVVDNSTELITRFRLAPIPIFILMGSLFFHSGLAIRVFDAIDKLFGNVPGRLCYLTVAGGATFSTLTGSSMANTAMLGSLMVPEMRRRGYSQRMSMGPVLGTGGLAMIIPPSSLAIVLASIAGVDVGRLLIAGILPGIILALLYAGMIFIQVSLRPEETPRYELARASWPEKLRAVAVNILPMGLVVFMVVGFIILGIATPTEAAAFGAIGVLILAVAFRLMSWEVIQKSFTATVQVTAMVFFIIISSTVFSQLLASSGATGGMLKWATGLEVSPTLMLIFMFAVLLLLGMFMDPVSMMLIAIPVFYPLLGPLEVDRIWFGIYMLLALEMSGTTPPFGLLLYIMLGIAPRGTTLFQVAAAAAPFLLCDAVLIALLLVFPQIALFLPGLMG